MSRPLDRRKFFARTGLAGLGAVALMGGCARLGLGIPAPDPPSREAQGLLSREPASLYWPHGDPGAWFNPWWRDPGSRWNLLKWKLLYRNEYAWIRWSREPEVTVVSNDGAYLARPETSASLTWVGHCSFVLKDGPDTVLTDPHFGPRALVYGRHRPPGVQIGKVPANAVALVSHNHYDHLDAWTVENLPKEVKWFVPMGLGRFIRELGREAVELNWWQSARHGRWTFTCLPAQHWSNRIGMARDATLWCSWVIEGGGRRYYHSGDTGYFHGFKEFARKFGPVDVAMLSIGAYAPRWMMRYPHMNPAEGYRAFQDLQARWMVPMHWGTFDLTDEPIDEPPRVLRRAVEEAGGDMGAIKLMAVGERWHLG